MDAALMHMLHSSDWLSLTEHSISKQCHVRVKLEAGCCDRCRVLRKNQCVPGSAHAPSRVQQQELLLSVTMHQAHCVRQGVAIEIKGGSVGGLKVCCCGRRSPSKLRRRGSSKLAGCTFSSYIFETIASIFGRELFRQILGKRDVLLSLCAAVRHRNIPTCIRQPGKHAGAVALPGTVFCRCKSCAAVQAVGLVCAEVVLHSMSASHFLYHSCSCKAQICTHSTARIASADVRVWSPSDCLVRD